MTTDKEKSDNHCCYFIKPYLCSKRDNSSKIKQLVQPEIYDTTMEGDAFLKFFFTINILAGADPGFQVTGGGLKIIGPNGARREICWGISCDKSRFDLKKSYFFQF